MVEVTEFGIPWIIRSDTNVSPYDPANVTRYNQASPLAKDGSKILPGTRRIALAAPEGSAGCIMTRDVLGYGTYEVTLIGRMDAFDPSVVSAVWTHNDIDPAKCVEVDFECSPWRDQNRTDRVQLGVFAGGQRFGAHVKSGMPSYLYHRIRLTQLPHMARVITYGWWEMNQKWQDYAYNEWTVPTPAMGRFKIGMGPAKVGEPYTLPKSASLPAKIVVAGFSFTPG